MIRISTELARVNAEIQRLTGHQKKKHKQELNAAGSTVAEQLARIEANIQRLKRKQARPEAKSSAPVAADPSTPAPLSAEAPEFCPPSASNDEMGAVAQPNDDADFDEGRRSWETKVNSDDELDLVQEGHSVSDEDSAVEEILSPQYREVEQLQTAQRQGFVNRSNPVANIRPQPGYFVREPMFGSYPWFAW